MPVEISLCLPITFVTLEMDKLKPYVHLQSGLLCIIYGDCTWGMADPTHTEFSSTFSFAVRQKHLQMQCFGPKRVEVAGDWRRRSNEKSNLYASRNITLIK
jgi:hypothetical protein